MHAHTNLIGELLRGEVLGGTLDGQWEKNFRGQATKRLAYRNGSDFIWTRLSQK